MLLKNIQILAYVEGGKNILACFGGALRLLKLEGTSFESVLIYLEV